MPSGVLPKFNTDPELTYVESLVSDTSFIQLLVEMWKMLLKFYEW